MKLVFDIETVSGAVDDLSESQQEYLFRYAEKEHDPKVRTEKIEEAERYLSLYPYTAKVIVIGMLNTETGKSLVLYESDESEEWEGEEKNIRYRSSNEKSMLEEFWSYSAKVESVVTFNGRAFDVPFLMIRSALQGIKPARNFIGNRFNNSAHIDLLEELTFHGLTRKFNLDFYCRSFGIESPKSKGVTGMDVKDLYEAGRIKEIAVYCGEDVRSTYELYKKWDTSLRF